MKQLEGNVALITGASRGIGAQVAKRFALEGAQVILLARNTEGLEAIDDEIRAGGGAATLVPIDLTDGKSIELLAQQVAARFGKLDVLVGNAAVLGEISPMGHSEPADWEKTFAVNLTANWQLIRCFDPLMKAAQNPRAMFVTSGVTNRAASYWGAYAVSKTALEMMVRIYAAENEQTSLRVNLIDPGVVRTRMRAQAFPGEDPLQHPEASTITDVFVKLALPGLQETGQKFHAQK